MVADGLVTQESSQGINNSGIVVFSWNIQFSGLRVKVTYGSGHEGAAVLLPGFAIIMIIW